MNPFKVLDLPETATIPEIKKKYRELANIHHPDKGGDTNKFKEVTSAYEVIDSEEKLAAYKAGPKVQWGDELFNSMYKDFFGRGAATPVKKTNFVSLNITLEEAFLGGKKKFKYKISNTCSHCGGLGATAFYKTSQPKNVCLRCNGVGAMVQEMEAEVEIQRGARSGVIVVVNAELHVALQVIPRQNFELKGIDVYSEVKLPLMQVFDGSEISVMTLHGEVKVSVPRCIQTDQFLRIHKKGFYDTRTGGFGHHILRVKISIPKLSDECCNKLVETLKSFPAPTL